MAGGQGTRLRPLTSIRPKPMIPLINKPILEHALDRLKNFQLKNVLLTLNYKSNIIKRYFKDGSEMNLDINYSVEKSPLGTAGSVKQAEKYLNDTFMVLSGDVISNMNFRQMQEFHKKKKALATLVLTRVADPTHFGIAVLNEDQEIVSYLEKPEKDQIFSNIANTGVYILEPEIFNYFDDIEGEIDFSKDIFPRLIEEKAGIYGYVFDGYWNDIGRPETYLKATYDLLNQKIIHKIYHKSLKKGVGKLGNIWMGNNVHMDPRVRIEGPVVIGSNCIIEKGCTLSKGTVLGEGVHIGRDSTIQSSVIMGQSTIESNSFLNGCIIDTNCMIEKNTIIEDGVVTGSGVEIGENSLVKSSRSIKNGTKIKANSIIDADYLE
ncbi:MAG: NDP-sugar synthase [Methanobacterium sp.]|nr:NDP-sugar synthase [Methanobacterium sp.]